MYDVFAAPTPLTGPHPLSRARAVLGALRRRSEPARVVVLPDGACQVVRRGERLRLGDALAGRYRAVYRVDEDGHTTDVECELPGRDGTVFLARIRLLWWVHDVQQAVQARVGDVRYSVQPLLEAYLGRATREYPAAEVSPAEDRVRRELTGDLPLEVGLTVRALAVTLRVDTPAPDRTAADPDDPVEQVRREILLEQERGRLAVLRAHNEVAAWRVRLDFYRTVVESGLPALLALRLMVDPAAATEVASYAVQGGDRGGRPWPAWSDPNAVEGGRDPGENGPGPGALGDVLYLPDQPDRDA